MGAHSTSCPMLGSLRMRILMWVGDVDTNTPRHLTRFSFSPSNPSTRKSWIQTPKSVGHLSSSRAYCNSRMGFLVESNAIPNTSRSQ
jgi:hypothetical protein